MISLFGEYSKICLHSSPPIEPPPPVTTIILFLIASSINSGLGSTSSRPNKSSISIFFELSISLS